MSLSVNGGFEQANGALILSALRKRQYIKKGADWLLLKKN